MKKLSINEPCKENWNEFTPKPEGGFCSSCQKVVIDFTDKSNQEISDILKAKAGENICGKIGTLQLDNFNDDFIVWQGNTTNEAFQSRFLWALALAFGLSLFTNNNLIGQEILGKIAYTETTTKNTAVVDTIPVIVPPTEVNDISDYIMGDIIVEEQFVDTLKNDTIPKIIADKCKKPMIPIKNIAIKQPVIMGAMVITEIPGKQKETDNAEQKTPVIESIGKIYPNPTNNSAILQLSVEESEMYKINIFNQRGKLCLELSNGIISEGRHELPINLSEFETGMYYISISSESHKSSIKLIKN